MFAVLALVGGVACTTSTGGAEGQTTTTTTTSTSSTETSADTSTQESTDSNGEWDETDDPPDTSGSFYAPPEDDLNQVTECDPFAQDCPEGEKCVPYASTGGAFPDANKCVQVLGADAPGDPCTSDGIVVSTDSCDHTSYCYPSDLDTGEGTCAAFCSGTADDPLCDEPTGCFIGYDGSMNLCLPTCDPLLQDCGQDQICAFDFGEGFYCLPPAPNLVPELGEPCGFQNDCVQGLCTNAELLDDCQGSACCAEYCDLTMPDVLCSDPAYECTSVFEEGMAPDPYAHVGVCMVPAP